MKTVAEFEAKYNEGVSDDALIIKLPYNDIMTWVDAADVIRNATVTTFEKHDDITLLGATHIAVMLEQEFVLSTRVGEVDELHIDKHFEAGPTYPDCDFHMDYLFAENMLWIYIVRERKEAA